MSSYTENNDSCQSCEFQDNLNILREVGFFSQFPLEALKVFAYLCTRVTFKSGDYLFRQQDDDAQAFYILSGETELLRDSLAGEMKFRNFGEGMFIGSLALVGNLRRLFSMRAVRDTTCIVITREQFRTTLEQFPELAPKITQNLVDSVHNWEERQFPEHSGDCKTFRAFTGVSLI